MVPRRYSLNPLRPRQNGHHFADNICFKHIFFTEIDIILTEISLQIVSRGQLTMNLSNGLDNGLVPFRRQAII